MEEISQEARNTTNQQLMASSYFQNMYNNQNYNPEWAARKTATGKNYNGGKYDSPYAEDDAGKAAIMGFFLALAAVIFFWG